MCLFIAIICTQHRATDVEAVESFRYGWHPLHIFMECTNKKKQKSFYCYNFYMAPQNWLSVVDQAVLSCPLHPLSRERKEKKSYSSSFTFSCVASAFRQHSSYFSVYNVHCVYICSLHHRAKYRKLNMKKKVDRGYKSLECAGHNSIEDWVQLVNSLYYNSKTSYVRLMVTIMVTSTS